MKMVETKHIKLMFVLITAVTILPSLSSGTNVYVQDGYGNIVYKNRTVYYVRPLPVGNAIYATNLHYDAEGLEVLYGCARSFVQDVQPNAFPFDILEKAVHNQFDLTTDYPELIKHFYGLTTCFVIGVSTFVVFIISGLCFCCCRGCCGNCGGDETQVYDANEGRMRMGLSQALFLMSLCVISSAVCIYVTDSRFTEAVEFTNKSVTTNIDDVDRFLKNTGAQFQYIVTDMYEVIQQAMTKDIDEMGNITASLIQKDLKVDQMIRELYMLDNYLKNVSLSLGQTELDISDLQSTEANLIARLETLADEIEATQAACSGSCLPTLCSNVVSNDIRHGSMNMSVNLPNLNDTKAQVDALNSTRFRDVARQALIDLERMAEKIDSSSASIRGAVQNTLNSYRTIVNDLKSGVFQTMTEAFPAKDLKRVTHDILGTVAKYDKYRRWFGFALTTLFVVIIALIILGLIIGICGDDVTALPTERNSVSNIGGNILLFGVSVLFLAGALLTLLAAVAFVFGGLLEKSCEPIEDLGIFKDFLDTDRVSDFSTTSAILGKTKIADKKFDLKAYDVLMRCRANTTAWVAFRIGEIVPLEEIIKYTKYLGSIGQDLNDLQSLDISSYRVLSNSMSTAMDDLQAAGLDSIDFQLINSTIELPTLLFTIDDTVATMQDIALNCNSPVKERWLEHIKDFETLKKTNVAEEDSIKIRLNMSASLLYTNVENIQNLTDSILHIAKAADEKIAKNVTGVLLEVSVRHFGRILSLAEGYTSEVTYSIYNDIAKCIPVWNLYKSAVVVLCDYGVDTLNGYWFSVGWGVLFFFPMIIVGAKLSKHYKIMESAVGYNYSPYEFKDDSTSQTSLPDVTDGKEESKF